MPSVSSRSIDIPGIPSKLVSKVSKPASGVGNSIPRNVRQQASNLLPRTLTSNRLSQVANLVRTKTAKTLQTRFLPTNNVTRSLNTNSTPETKSIPKVSAIMVQEDQQKAEAECRASDVLTAESSEPTIPMTSKATLLRSETFELTSPDGDRTINLGQAVHSTITMLKTSSPNSNTSPAKRKFGSFGESSHIFNSSEIPEPDQTLILQSDNKNVSKPLIQSPQSCNTFLKNSSGSVISNISHIGTPTSTEKSSLCGPGDATVVFQTTMVHEKPKLIDITTNVTPKFQHNPWNMTEVLAGKNVTHLVDVSSDETILGPDQPMELLMDVDEPEDLVENSKFSLNNCIF